MNMSRAYPGVVIGLVKEIDAELGRIKVDLQCMSPPQRSNWAPIAVPMSGGQRGVYFMPELEDEVLVAFDQGQVDHPYVVGYLWNGVDKPPESNKDFRVIKTPGGHTMRFEDVDGHKKIVIKTDGGRSITMDDTPSGKIEIKSTQNTVVLDDTSGTAKISIQAGIAGLVSVKLDESPPKICVKAMATSITLDAMGVTVSSPGLVDVTCASATINSTVATTINTGVLSVNSGIATFAGVVQCSALITQAVVSPVYTPGIGNLLGL
jgi:phage baseplate assembly protein gpV